jgi:Ricin-type beta-trefoil lectin domain
MTTYFREKKRKMSHILRVLGTVPLLGILAASFGPANAAMLQLNANAPYLCVAVNGGDTANGTPVIAYSCSGWFDEQWNYTYGQFQGIGSTGTNAGTCLSTTRATTPGTPVQLWACDNNVDQQRLIENGTERGLPTSTLIVGVQSGYCLDSSPGSGKQLVINPCTGVASQNWIVR